MKKIISVGIAIALGVAFALAQVAYQNVNTTPKAQLGKTWTQTVGVITSSAGAISQSYAVTLYAYGQVAYFAVTGGTVAVSANFLASGTTTQFDPSVTAALTLLDITGSGMTVSSPTKVTWTLQANTVQPTTVYYGIGGWR